MGIFNEFFFTMMTHLVIFYGSFSILMGGLTLDSFQNDPSLWLQLLEYFFILDIKCYKTNKSVIGEQIKASEASS